MQSASHKVAIIGQGYVGLPVAMRAVEVGYRVVGVDIDEQRVQQLKAGRSYVGDVTDSQLVEAIATGRYSATTSYSDIAEFDYAVITVPTPLRETLPDLSFIEQSAQAIGEHLTKGATVVLESTTYPGTTEELVVPILEAVSELTAGVDFHVGYSPERIDPGNNKFGFVNTPKVVSGIDPASLKSIDGFYSKLVLSTVPVSTPKEAELTKLLENTFRHVNIALVNELAIFAHQLNINIWESIDAASTKPFGYMRFTPGPGVGGHCLPIDPSYLAWHVKRELGQSFRFVELANIVNEHMPMHVCERVTAMLNDQEKPVRNSTVLLIGLAYKKNTSDIRESPALRLIELLQQRGALVEAADPHVENYRWPSGVARVEFDSESINRADLVVVITDHDEFNFSCILDSGAATLDTRNRVSGPHVQSL